MSRPDARRVGRVVGPAAAVIAIEVLAASVVVSAATYQGSAFEHDVPAWLVAAALAAGAALATASWSERRRRPPAAIGLSVVLAALFMPGWAGWPWLPATLQAVALAFGLLAVPGAAQVGLLWFSDVRSTRILRVTWGLALAAACVHLLAYNPLADPGCAISCIEVDVPAAGLLTTQAAGGLVAALTVLAGIAASAGLASKVRAGSPALVAPAALVAVVLFSVPAFVDAVEWTAPLPPIAQVAPAVLGGLVIGVAPLWVEVRTRGIRLQVQELVDRLVAAPNDRRTDRAVADPPWEIAFTVPGEDRWVDASGDDVAGEPEPGRSVVVADANGPLLRLALAPGVDPDAMLASLTPATMLALRNARLAAVSRAQLAQLQASQRRIVAAADAERERIERDLHDGAQQHLVGAAFQLSLARNRLPADDGALAEADAAVREALARLRAIGHGIFPAVLMSEGLEAALEDLGRESGVPTTVDVQVPDLDRPAAFAAYAVADVALRAAARKAASSATITGTARDGRLVLTVRLSGSAGMAHADLVDVSDRVGALGGQVTVAPVDDGVIVSAEVPCGSSSPTM
jgi:signal transduction histidine kinase